MANLTEKVKNSNVSVLHVVVGALVVAVIVLFIGGMWQRHNLRDRVLERGPAMGGFGRRLEGHRAMGGKNADSVTGKVTSINGGEFKLDDKTTVKTDSNTRFDGTNITGLKVGDQVVVAGPKDTDGNVQAKRVLINPPKANDNPST